MKKKLILLLTGCLFFVSACSGKATKEAPKQSTFGLKDAKDLKMISLSQEDIENELKQLEKEAEKCESYEDFLKWEKASNTLQNKLHSNLGNLTIKTYLNNQDNEAFDALLENERLLNKVSESTVKSYRIHLEKDYNKEVESALSKLSPALVNEIKISKSEADRKKIVTLKNQLIEAQNAYQQKEGSNETDYNGKTYRIDELDGENNKAELEQQYYQELLTIYSKQIKIEKELAAQLGYDSVFNMYHQEYNRPYQQEDVEKYFALTKKYFSPLINKLPEPEDSKKINTEKIATEEIGKIFKENNQSLYQIWQEMLDKNLYNIRYDKNKPQQFAAVYSNPYYKTPFLVGNFDDRVEDLQVFIHEFGHFFADVLQKDAEVANNDIHEIYSQCLELLISLKLEDIAPQAKIKFIEQILMNQLISTTMIQEFQTRIYEEEELTLEKMEIINKQMLMEYFGDDTVGQYEWITLMTASRPLSMTEYFLGAITALQVHQTASEDFEVGFEKYMKMINYPEQTDLTKIVTEAGFKSPTEESTMKEVAQYLETLLEKND